MAVGSMSHKACGET